MYQHERLRHLAVLVFKLEGRVEEDELQLSAEPSRGLSQRVVKALAKPLEETGLGEDGARKRQQNLLTHAAQRCIA